MNKMSKDLSFFKGGNDIVASLMEQQDSDGAIELVRRDLRDIFNSKNLALLLGSGCSSYRDDASGEELGIPTMEPMAKRFLAPPKDQEIITGDEHQKLKTSLGIDLSNEYYSNNLERLMEVLFSIRFVLTHSDKNDLTEALPLVDKIISKATQHVLDTCRTGAFSNGNDRVQKLYEAFYRKLIHRDRALPRPWVFTTNYDLFNETAMDRLGIPYINGFQGSVERRFNPAIFRYTLAEQLDLASKRWSSVDSLIYFVKLHGSISWQSRQEGIFPVVETLPAMATSENLLVYPTPAKQNASFASPYSDMFRELQTRVAREQTALITLGYSFSDEHVNNIVFQALTIPTFRLVAFVAPDVNETVKKLRELSDPRIWIIGTESSNHTIPTQAHLASRHPEDDSSNTSQLPTWRAHYFESVINDFMAAEVNDDANQAIEKVLHTFLSKAKPKTSQEGM